MEQKPSDFITVAQAEEMIRKAVAAAMTTFCQRPMKIFGLGGTAEYAAKVVKHLGMTLTPHTEKEFEDGETYVKSGPEHSDGPIGNVRGHNVFVIQSLYADGKESVADKFMKLMIMCGSLRDASAAEVIPVIPHLAWARQDRKTESRAPITSKYVAHQIERAGASRALFFEVHNLSAEQNAHTIPIDCLESTALFAEFFADRLLAEGKTKKLKVLTPDTGGLPRCTRFRNALLKKMNGLGAKIDDIEIVIFDKVRIKGEVRGGRIIGDVEDADVIAHDDMISTGTTMNKSCKAVEAAGGRLYAICATHGLFCGKANEIFEGLNTKIVVADTIKPWRLNESNRRKLHIVDTTKMVADAIRRIHSGTGSISELLRP